MEDYSEFESAFNSANKESRESYFSWIKVVISITTPSLILLIGLQSKDQELSCAAIYLLVISIITMSVTILSGLVILNSESGALLELRNQIAENWEKQKSLKKAEVVLPNYYKLIKLLFSIATFSSIVAVTTFGVLKYVT